MSLEPSAEAGPTSSEPAQGAAGPELLISHLLRSGVALSLTLMTLGMTLTFFRHPDYFASVLALQRLTAPEYVPHSLADVLAGVMQARGRAFVMVGLLVMMATPVLRVALALILFRQQRDRLFVGITAAVLSLLLLSLLLGRAHG